LPHSLKIPHTTTSQFFNFQADNPRPFSPIFQTVHVMCNNKIPSSPAQVIEGQYLDQQKLMTLLKTIYGTSEEGKNNFRVEVNHMTPFQWPLLTSPNSSDSIGTRYTLQSMFVTQLSLRYPIQVHIFPTTGALTICPGSDTGLSSI
jgi:hypothetical protein